MGQIEGATNQYDFPFVGETLHPEKRTATNLLIWGPNDQKELPT
jgi:hypothetical protein